MTKSRLISRAEVSRLFSKSRKAFDKKEGHLDNRKGIRQQERYPTIEGKSTDKKAF